MTRNPTLRWRDGFEFAGLVRHDRRPYFTNAVDTRTRGLDFNARYVWSLSPDRGRVTLTAGFNVNHTKATRFKATPPQLAAVGVTTPLFDLTERIRMERGQPRNNVNLAAGYDFKSWSFLLRNVRYGDVDAVQFTSATPAQVAALTPGITSYRLPTEPAGANSQIVQRYKAKWLTDLDVTFRATRQLSLSIGANNLFDIMPHRTVPSVIADGTVSMERITPAACPICSIPRPTDSMVFSITAR